MLSEVEPTMRLPLDPEGNGFIGSGGGDGVVRGDADDLRHDTADLGRGVELPASLAQLVPDYLPEVPLDYFDRAPIRYSRTNRAVWGIGPDNFSVNRPHLEPEEYGEFYFDLNFAAPPKS